MNIPAGKPAAAIAFIPKDFDHVVDEILRGDIPQVTCSLFQARSLSSVATRLIATGARPEPRATQVIHATAKRARCCPDRDAKWRSFLVLAPVRLSGDAGPAPVDRGRLAG